MKYRNLVLTTDRPYIYSLTKSVTVHSASQINPREKKLGDTHDPSERPLTLQE